MKTLRKILWRLLSLALAVAVGYGLWIAWQGMDAERQEQGLGEIPVAEAAVRDITVSVSATGVLRPVRVVQVKSKAAGEVTHMPVELGDRVSAGDLIAQIGTDTLEQELAQARADLESARTRSQVTSRQYERARDLYGQDLVSEEDLETAQQNASNARAQLLRAEAELQLRQERLDDATVRAPVDGTIITRDAEEGTIISSSISNVSGGTTLVEMADLSRLEMRTLVDEIDIGQVKPGLPVVTTVEAYPDRQFHGEVVKIEPQAVIEQQVTTFPVLSYVENTAGLLLPGMNGDVEIVIHRRPGVVAIPNQGVRSVPDAAQVARLLGLEFDRQALTSGDLLTDFRGGEGRGLMPEARADGGGDGGAEERRRGAGRRAAGDTEGGARRPGGAGSGGLRGDGERPRAAADAFGVDSRPEPGVVFVLDGERRLVPRPVMTGVQDWEHTEILDGLEPGDEVVLLPSTSLLMSQQALRERFSRFTRVPGVG